MKAKMSKAVQKNKIDKVIDNLYPATGTAEGNAKRRRKIAERILMSLAIVGTISVASLYQDLIQRIIFPEVESALIYGTWVEKDVASYAKDKFVISDSGISVNGAIVATSFTFDGRYFEYIRAGKPLKFKLLGESYTEMKLVSPAHYSPIFRRNVIGAKAEKGIRSAY